MGKRSKRAGRAARDVHATIRAHEADLNAAERFGIRDAADFPEVAELLEACRSALAAGVPRFVYFKGRNYWLRVRAWLDLVREGKAPKPVKIGRAAAWVESEVADWLRERIRTGRAG